MLRLGYPYEPPTLDPLAPGGGSPATRDILRPVLPALFGLNASLRPMPELVDAWPRASDIRADPFSVRLRLRDASWSDGRPITADDVRFSWDKLKDGPTGYRYRFLRDVEVTDQRTFTLRFDRVVRRWWSLFSLDDMVLPAHAYSAEWAKRPTVAGGPFELAEWEEGLRIRLVRNELYWDKAVLAGINVVFVPNEQTRFQLLDRGELDAFFSEGDINMGRRARARDYLRLSGALDGRKAASGAWGPTWWELNLDDDVSDGVARAVVELADPALVAEILEDTGAAMDGIPAVFPRRAGAIAGTWAGRGSLDEARSLVGDAADRALEITFARENAGGSLASFLHFRVREVGITLELVALEGGAFDRGLDEDPAPDGYLRVRRGADAPDASSYASFSGEPGSAPVDDHVAGAETEGATVSGRPVVGVAQPAWSRAQDGLEQAATAIPLARIRTWIIGREGVAGPHAQGALTGPLWNAATWRFL